MHQIFFDSGMFNFLKDCGSSSSMLDLPVNCNMSPWMESKCEISCGPVYSTMLYKVLTFQSVDASSVYFPGVLFCDARVQGGSTF